MIPVFRFYLVDLCSSEVTELWQESHVRGLCYKYRRTWGFLFRTTSWSQNSDPVWFTSHRILSILPDSCHRDLPVQIRTASSHLTPRVRLTRAVNRQFPSNPFNHPQQSTAHHAAASWTAGPAPPTGIASIRGTGGDRTGLVGSPAVGVSEQRVRFAAWGRWGPRPASHWKDALTWRPCRGCVGRQLSTMSSSASPSLLKLS